MSAPRAKGTGLGCGVRGRRGGGGGRGRTAADAGKEVPWECPKVLRGRWHRLDVLATQFVRVLGILPSSVAIAHGFGRLNISITHHAEIQPLIWAFHQQQTSTRASLGEGGNRAGKKRRDWFAGACVCKCGGEPFVPCHLLTLENHISPSKGGQRPPGQDGEGAGPKEKGPTRRGPQARGRHGVHLSWGMGRGRGCPPV